MRRGGDGLPAEVELEGDGLHAVLGAEAPVSRNDFGEAEFESKLYDFLIWLPPELLLI